MYYPQYGVDLPYNPDLYPIVKRVHRILGRECYFCHKEEHNVYKIETPLKTFYTCLDCGKECYGERAK